jgi:hypothetical protein
MYAIRPNKAKVANYYSRILIQSNLPSGQVFLRKHDWYSPQFTSYGRQGRRSMSDPTKCDHFARLETTKEPIDEQHGAPLLKSAQTDSSLLAFGSRLHKHLDSTVQRCACVGIRERVDREGKSPGLRQVWQGAHVSVALRSLRRDARAARVCSAVNTLEMPSPRFVTFEA